MAASAHPSRTFSSEAAVSPVDRHRTTSFRLVQPSQQLPNGACSFRDLSQGHICGCRRFWLNDTALGQEHGILEPSVSITGGIVCHCGHHACFHDWERPGLPAGHTRAAESTALQHSNGFDASPPLSTTNPITSSIPLRPSGATEVTPDEANDNDLGRVARTTTEKRRPALLRPLELPSTQSSFVLAPDITLRSAIHLQAGPSQRSIKEVSNPRSILPVQVSSQLAEHPVEEFAQSATEIATPSISNVGSPALQAADEAFQAVKDGLEELDSGLASRGTCVLHPGVSMRHDFQRSRTSKSILVASGNFQDHRRQLETNEQPHTGCTPSPKSAVAEQLLSQIASLKAILLSIPNFRTSLSGLYQRVDALENMSFCHGSVEELQDKFEHIDGRLLDVESKIEDLDRNSDASLHHGHQRNRLSWNGSSESHQGSLSDRSPCSATPSAHELRVVDRLEAAVRLESIEQRLSSIEALAPPSIFHPWEVEVVLLPWGRGLNGLWSPAFDISQGGEPTRAWSNASSNCSMRAQEEGWPLHAVTKGCNSAEEWLFPRACGPTFGTFGRVYERLRSRGFIRTITITGSSAVHLESEVTSTFRALLQTLNDRAPIPSDAVKKFPQFLALQAPFIPLRKVHKSSRLRFLTPSELATQSLWTAEFFNSSIFMKAPMAGVRRLFITQPSAYLQVPGRFECWSWQKLRELPRIQQEAETIPKADLSFVGEADALEGCWTWDARLDPLGSGRSSFESSRSKSSFGSAFASHPLSPQQTIRELSADPVIQPVARSEEPENERPHEQNEDSDTGERHAPITPVSEFPLSVRPSQVFRRPESLPTTDVLDAANTARALKRQIASFDNASSQSITDTSRKRRRGSKTPSALCVGDAGWGFTPRLSREPPSPGVYQRPASSRSGVDVDSRLQSERRGFTPLAYATPFSNNLCDGRRGDGDVDVEGERGSQSEQHNSGNGSEDEVWEGVEEEEDDEEDELGR